MQTTLETIGQLERRLNLSVPVAEIESEVAKRLARLAKNVKVPGFRPGKVPMKMVAQQYGPQVRTRSHHRRRAVRASPTRCATRTCASRAIRASSPRRTRRSPRTSSSRRCSRSIPTSGSATLSTVIDRASGGGRRPGGRRAHDRRPAQAADALRTGRARRPTGDRAIVDFTGRIDGVEFPGRPGEGFRDRARRRPDAARVRGRGDRHERRRDEGVLAHVSGRLSRQGSRGQGGGLHADGEVGRGAEAAGGRRRVRQGVRHRERQPRRAQRRNRGEPRSSSSSARSRPG